MIKTLYKKFQHWSEKGSVYLLGDTHFEDEDCKLMDPNWVSPEEQVKLINKYVTKNDTFIHLGDVGKGIEWVKKIRGYKVLIMGNHDKGVENYEEYFDEIYQGPLFISEKILLSHEQLLNDCYLNIHGHDHGGLTDGLPNSLNLAANKCNYTPYNLGKNIEKGLLKDIDGIHRQTVKTAFKRKLVRNRDHLLELHKELLDLYDILWIEDTPVEFDVTFINMAKEILEQLNFQPEKITPIYKDDNKIISLEFIDTSINKSIIVQISQTKNTITIIDEDELVTYDEIDIEYIIEALCNFYHMPRVKILYPPE